MPTPEEVARIKREALHELAERIEHQWDRPRGLTNQSLAAYVREDARHYPAQPKRVRAEVDGYHLRGHAVLNMVGSFAMPRDALAALAALDARADAEGMVTACDCHKHERQVCDVCQGVTGAEVDAAPTPESTDSFNSGESTPVFTHEETRVWWINESTQIAYPQEPDLHKPWNVGQVIYPVVPRAALDESEEACEVLRTHAVEAGHEFNRLNASRDALRLQLDEAREERDLARQCAKYESDVAGNAIADMEKASSGAEAALCFAEKATQEVRLELAVARLEGLGYRKMVGDLENERDRLQRACSDMLPAEMRRDLEHEVASLRTTLERAQYVADQQTLIAGEWEQRYETINAQLREATRKVTQEEFEKVKSAMEPFRWYGSVDPIARAAIAALGRTIEGEA